MSIASLEAFLARVQEDPGLRELLATAPDAASVAAIARTAGFPVNEWDVWQATAVSPDDLAAADDLAPVAEAVQPAAGVIQAESPASGAGRLDPWQQAEPPAANARAMAPGGRLPDPWFPEEPLTRFVHQAQGDAELQDALASAPDAAAVASIAQAAGYPVSAVDLWLASGTTPDELAASLRPPSAESMEAPDPLDSDAEQDISPPGAADPPVAAETSEADETAEAAETAEADEAAEAPFFGAAPPAQQALAEDAIQALLAQAATDADLRQALAAAPDAAAVAAIARQAGHPVEELALWLASGAAFEEVQAEPEPPSLGVDPLALFLRAVEVDTDLQLVLASAPDAATVAAIARIAGFPLTAADLWAASHASPRELELERRVLEELLEELMEEQMVIVER
jgi:predicted ribosomally synthesized peptide with nif11-like leader